MPNRKRTEIIRRILDSGYLCELRDAADPNLPKLKIENNPNESYAFDYCGGMGVILDLQVTSNRAVQIQDFGDLELLGRPCNVDWWASEKSNVYKLYRGPEYPCDVVLNDRTAVLVKPGQPLKGVLLGRSAVPIPSQYSHGFRLGMTLSILDGSDNWHSAQLSVRVDEHLCSKSRTQSRGSLFARKREPVNRVEDAAARDVSRPHRRTADASHGTLAPPDDPVSEERTTASGETCTLLQSNTRTTTN
jgi:hypothetical protein